MVPCKAIRENGSVDMLNTIYEKIADLDEAYKQAYQAIQDAGDPFSAGKLRNHKRTSLGPFRQYYARLYKAYQDIGLVPEGEIF
jgi:hypothetical protein